MSELPEVPPSILDPVRRYFIAFKRRLEALLRGKADLIEGTLYISPEQPLEYIDADGTHYRMGETAIPPMAGAPWFTSQEHGARVNGVRMDGNTAESGFIDLDAEGQAGLIVRVGRVSVAPTAVRVLLLNGDGTGGVWCNIDRDAGMAFGSPSGGQKGAGSINSKILYESNRRVTAWEGWKSATLLNSWVNYGGSFQLAQYRRDMAGNVQLRGLVKDGPDASRIMTLPSGYRPKLTSIFLVAGAGSGSGLGYRINIGTDGGVVLVGTAPSYLALDNIQFHTG